MNEAKPWTPGPKPQKDLGQLMEDADGHPQWLKEALSEIFQRLPPVPPPAPPALPPSWDPSSLARLQLDPGAVPLDATNRWYLATWLERLARDLREGTADEGDSKDGFRTIYTLAPAPPSSGPRRRRTERP